MSSFTRGEWLRATVGALVAVPVLWALLVVFLIALAGGASV